MEGIDITLAGASDGSVPYMSAAIAEMTATMSGGKGDIRLGANRCGIVYEMKLDRAFKVSRMVPVIAGFGYDAETGYCPAGSISIPDNLIVRANCDVLVGEDARGHENGMLWIWQRGEAD